jgi:hypothetical protein
VINRLKQLVTQIERNHYAMVHVVDNRPMSNDDRQLILKALKLMVLDEEDSIRWGNEGPTK